MNAASLNLAIQGKFCAPGIQSNRLKLKRPEWYVFTIIDLNTGRRMPLDKQLGICNELNLIHVPIEERGTHFPYKTMNELLKRAKGKYSSGIHKEGIVIRPTVPVYSSLLGTSLSGKVLNNDYLLKE